MNSSFQIIALTAAARITASATGDAIDVSGYSGECRIVLHSSAGEGASHTSTTKVQHSDDGESSWTDSVVEFTQVTNADDSFQVISTSIDRFKKYVRVVDTLGGTSPAFTRAVTLVAKAERG